MAGDLDENQKMVSAAKTRKAGWIVVLAVLAGAAVVIPSMVSLAISVYAAAAALLS